MDLLQGPDCRGLWLAARINNRAIWWAMNDEFEVGYDHWCLISHWQCWGSKPRFFLWRKRWISRKEGRSFSSRCQHSCMRSRTSRGHPWGVDRKMVGLPSRHIFERLDSILASLWLSWGCSRAKVRISQRVTPNDQTSVLVVNFPNRTDSQAIQRIGSIQPDSVR